MARWPLLPEDPDDRDLAAVFAAVRARGVEKMPILYRVLGRSPRMLEAWTDFAWPLRLEATTPRPLRELQIVRVGQLTGTGYLERHHRAIALRVGTPAEKLDALDGWRTTDAFDDAERAALGLTDETTIALDVRDETFGELERHYSPAEIVELTMTAAFYSCVARVLRVFQVGFEDDE